MGLSKWVAAGLIAASPVTAAIAQPPPAGSIQVRMLNGTGLVMERIRINSPMQAEAERLAPGEATPYQTGPRMMGGLSMEAMIGGAFSRFGPMIRWARSIRPAVTPMSSRSSRRPLRTRRAD